MTHVPSLVIGAAIGAALAVAAALFVAAATRINTYLESWNNRYQNNVPPRPHESLGFHPNLTCPYCNQYLASSDPILPCGHKYHLKCHKKSTNKNCTFCVTDTEKKLSEASSSGKNEPINTDGDCCFCKTPLSNSETRQRDCGHVAHKECYENFSTLVKCQDCPKEEQ